MSTNSRHNFNFRIIEKKGNTLTLQVMIINEEQHSFYRNDTFFIPALWSASFYFKELKKKTFLILISEKNAFDGRWLAHNFRKFINGHTVVNLINFPLIHDYKNFSESEWSRIWEERIDLPTGIFSIDFANEEILDGFKPGMDWDYGVLDPLAPDEQIPLS